MRKIYNKLLKVFEVVMAILFALLVIVVFMNVFFRYVLRHSLPWAEELSRFLFVWITFIGAVLVNHFFGHMRLDMLSQILPKIPSVILEIIVSLLVIWVMYIMMRGGYSMMMDSLDYHSPALELPYGIVSSVVPVCCGIMFFQAIVRCFTLSRKLTGRRKEGDV
jgi:TRAP-type C4-dicarboxylate transport system permease small subunit